MDQKCEQQSKYNPGCFKCGRFVSWIIGVTGCQSCQTDAPMDLNSGGDEMTSWTHSCSCRHTLLCILFSTNCPGLSGWCNRRQASSFVHLPSIFPSSLFSRSFPTSFSPPASLVLLFYIYVIIHFCPDNLPVVPVSYILKFSLNLCVLFLKHFFNLFLPP